MGDVPLTNTLRGLNSSVQARELRTHPLQHATNTTSLKDEVQKAAHDIVTLKKHLDYFNVRAAEIRNVLRRLEVDKEMFSARIPAIRYLPAEVLLRIFSFVCVEGTGGDGDQSSVKACSFTSSHPWSRLLLLAAVGAVISGAVDIYQLGLATLPGTYSSSALRIQLSTS